MPPIIKTRSEQRLEWLRSELQSRRLTNEEWAEVGRCEHAIYCRAQKVAA
jgi:hypothetical protein